MNRHPHDGIVDRCGIGDDEARPLCGAFEAHSAERELRNTFHFAVGRGQPKAFGADIFTGGHEDRNDDAQRLPERRLLRDRTESDGERRARP